MTTVLSHLARRWAIPLCLVLGIFTYELPAQAQSRGQTSGRETKSEKKETTKRSTSKRSEASEGNQRQSSSSRSNRSSRERSASPNSSRQSSNRRAGSSSQEKSSSSMGQSRSSSRTRAGSSTQQSRNSRSTENMQRNSSSVDRSSSNRSRSESRGSSSESSRTRNRSSNETSQRGRSSSRVDRSGSQGRDSRQSSRSRTDRNEQANRSRTSDRDRTRVDVERSRTTERSRTVEQSRTSNAPARRSTSRNRSEGEVRIHPAPNHRDGRNHNWNKKKHYGYNKPNYRVSPVYHHRPHIQINVNWPWQNRYRRKWKPHYRYRQVVYVNVGWGKRYRQAQIDVRTEYHQRVRYADHRKAVVDIYLDKIEVYEDGYFFGEVVRIPDHLSHIKATIYRNGDIVYDRDVFLVGDPRSGFEMISTQHYDGYVLDHYQRSHGYKVGRLDFRRRRVESRRYSRLFDPYDFHGHAPISLLPEDRYLADYGYESVSYNYYTEDCDPYYGGNYDDDYYDYYEDGGYSRHSPQYNRPNSAAPTHDRQTVQASIAASGPIKLSDNKTIQTRGGVSVSFQREGQLERIR